MASSMLRGFLRIVVIKALAQGSKSGYSLMKEIEQRVGARPSAGSIYPLLERLKKEGIVTLRGVGRRKEYSVTTSGKQKLEQIEQKRDECLKNIAEGLNMLSAMTGEDMTFPKKMIETIKKGEYPFKEINPEYDNVREALFKRMQDGTLKKKSMRVRKIMAQLCKELND